MKKHAARYRSLTGIARWLTPRICSGASGLKFSSLIWDFLRTIESILGKAERTEASGESSQGQDWTPLCLARKHADASYTAANANCRFPSLLAPLASIATVSPARTESRMKPCLHAGFRINTCLAFSF